MTPRQSLVAGLTMTFFEHRLSKFPGAQLIVYDSVGHIPQEEIPARSTAGAAAFMLAVLQPSP